MRYVSIFLSWIFHPMLMVTYAALLYFFFIPSDFPFPGWQIPVRICILLFISTVLLPIMAMLVMKRFGKIRDLMINVQQERNWPLLMAAIIYIGAYYAVHARVVPVFIQLFLLGSVLGILFSLLINLRWKISLHMIGAGGLCGGIAVMLMLQGGNPALLALCFLLTGLLGTARLYLEAHTPAQIAAGFACGFFTEFLLLFLLLK